MSHCLIIQSLNALLHADSRAILRSGPSVGKGDTRKATEITFTFVYFRRFSTKQAIWTRETNGPPDDISVDQVSSRVHATL